MFSDTTETNETQVTQVTLNLESGHQLAKNLTQIISEGIKLSKTSSDKDIVHYNKKISETLDDKLDVITESIQQNTSAFSDTFDILTDMSEKTIGKLEEQKKVLEKIEQNSPKNPKNLEEEQKKGKSFLKWVNKVYQSSKIIFNTSKKIATIGYDVLEEASNRYSDLSAAGIRLTQGFDETAWKLSNDVGMKIDDFLKVLTDHNKYVNSLTLGNKLGGEDTIAQGLKNIIGLQGTTKAQAESILKHFNETMLDGQDLRNMTSEEYTRQLTNTTKHLQALSKATGLSVQQIIEKNRLDEQDIVMRRLQQNDEKAFTMLKTSGMSSEMMQYVMLGTISKKVVEAMAVNPELARLLEDSRRAYASSGALGLEKLATNANYNIQKATPEQLQLLSYTSADSPLRGMLDSRILEFFNSYGAKGGITSAEEQNTKNYQKALEAQREIDRAYNDYLKMTTLKIDDMGKVADKIKWSMEKIRVVTSTLADNEFANTVGPWVGPALNAGGEVVGSVLLYKTMKQMLGQKATEEAIKRGPKFWTKGKIAGGAAGAGLVGAAYEGYNQYQRLEELDKLRKQGLMSDLQYKDERNKGIGSTVGTGLGAAGGAALGAAIGTALFPGLGTAAGALVGGAFGLVGSLVLGAAGGAAGGAIGDSFIPDESYQQHVDYNLQQEEYLKMLEREKEAQLSIMSDRYNTIQLSVDRILTNDNFDQKTDNMIHKLDEMIIYLKNISGKDLSLTERAVASQSR